MQSSLQIIFKVESEKLILEKQKAIYKTKSLFSTSD